MRINDSTQEEIVEKRGTAKGVAQMGWESRGNCRYYYKKVRVGQQVFSKYVGTGLFADLTEVNDLMRRNKGIEERIMQRKHKEQIENFMKLNEQIQEVERLVEAIVQSTLLAEGYHTHHREWRKRRCQK